MIQPRAVLLLLLAACGGPSSTPAGSSPATTHARAEVWTCSMHPQVREDHPGPCPLCGMDLVKVDMSDADAQAARTLSVDPRVVQTTGIQVHRVQPTTLFRHLRALGEITTAEDQVTVVTPRVEGWVTSQPVNTTGTPVRAGQILATIYAPALVEAQQELLLSRGAGAREQASRARLFHLGMADVDIDKVRRTGRALEDVPLRAPRSGTLLSLGATDGSHVTGGTEVARIADLSAVWVLADIPEDDTPWIAVGQHASLDVPGLPGPARDARVDFLYPTVDPVRRTLRVRLVVENASGALRPGQLATVRLGFRQKDDVLTVPRQAILDSGERRIVFVADGHGRFSPREIQTGLVGDRRQVEVLSGLHPGEEVVANGLFLLDADAQLQEALRGLSAPPDQPAPDHYACPMHPDQTRDAPGRCPVCGMDLEPVEAVDPPPDDDHAGHTP